VARSAERWKSLVDDLRRQPEAMPSKEVGYDGLVRSVPAWVARLRVLPVGRREWWLLCERRSGRGGPVSGQIVFAAGPGRYMLDTHDPATGACIAKESAEGEPIVAGLACPGRAVLVHVCGVGSHSQ
jgi:hypothetical protein